MTRKNCFFPQRSKNFLVFLTNSDVLRSIFEIFGDFWDEMESNFYFFVVAVCPSLLETVCEKLKMVELCRIGFCIN